MGCAQSRIDNEESVARCKERRNLMREVLIARNAFAAGHSGYAMALKNTGAATMPSITMQHRKGTREIDSDAIAEGNEDEEDEKEEKGNARKGLKNGAGVVGSQASPSSPA